MLDVVGKGVEQDTPTNLVIADSVKENCRQELLNVSLLGFENSLTTLVRIPLKCNCGQHYITLCHTATPSPVPCVTITLCHTPTP